MTSKEYVRNAHSNPPRCIAQLEPVPIQPIEGMDEYPFLAYFTIGCSCGNRANHLLGHFVKSYNRREPPVFVSPLSIECPACGRVSPFFDDRIHGYNGEQESNDLEDKGSPVRFPCPKCGESSMEIMPGFSYQFEDDALAEFGARTPDYFDGLWLFAKCIKCGELTSPAGFECA